MSSLASTINAAIVTALKAINGTGDYQVNVGSRVYRHAVLPQLEDPETEFPYICFGSLSYEEEPFDVNNNSKRVEAEVELRLFVRYDKDAEDSGIMDLYSDVKVALEDDYTLGGLVMDSVVGSLDVAEVMPDFGFVDGHVSFSYVYFHTAGDPTT
jgi:hypothetical protein